jgi:hypothetical protein
MEPIFSALTLEVRMPALKWTDELIDIEAKKYSSRKEFSRFSGSAYAAARIRGILDQVCRHMTPMKTVWSDDLIRKVAKGFKSRTEFFKGNNAAYEAARKRGRGFLDSICTHMKTKKVRWSIEMLTEEAAKYLSRGDFQRGDSGNAYQFARKHGMLDLVCSHMEKKYSIWTKKSVEKEAARFSARSEFSNKSAKAYDYACRHGILDQVCAHMRDGVNGFKSGRRAILYQFRVVRGRKDYYKVGISNGNPLIRAKQFGIRDGVYIELTHYIEFEDGAECRQMEKELHAAAKAKGLQYIGKDLMKSGFTEIFTKPLLH